MNNRLMREYEEFEGLRGVTVEDANIVVEENEDDAALGHPRVAAELTAIEVQSALAERSMKVTGFPDTDRDLLQKVFDEEFKSEIEIRRARRREQLKKDAQQRGLRQRRLDMEKALQEEQDELVRDHQLGMMIDLIKENVTATDLRLNINSVSARSLAKAMWINNSITCLDLSSNNLNDHAGAYLARILKRNNTLRKLELDNNHLGPKSCLAFGESLLVNTSLVYLSLDSNLIVTENDMNGFQTLCAAIRANKTLVNLNLWRTGIPEMAGNLLASALEENETLLFCDIGHNYIDIGDVKRITDKLDANLAQFERYERQRRKDEVVRNEVQRKKEEDETNETKRVELSHWLQDRREDRAEKRRDTEEQRILKIQEEYQERQRLLAIRREEDRKAAEEAAAKKAKNKKGKDKKGGKK